MRNRILGAMLLLAAVAIIGFGIPLALTIQGRDRDEALLELSAAAATAAVAVPGSFARENDLPELPDPAPEMEVGLYTAAGVRLLGSGPDRADRPVAAALRQGSAQQDRDRLVVAIPVSDEEIVVGVIRTSLPNRTVSARTQRSWVAMAGLAAAVFVASALFAAQRSRTLSAPLERLRLDADQVGDGGELLTRHDSGVEEIDAVHSALRDAASRLNGVLARERALSADIAHQLRTPLASLRLRLEIEQTSPGEAADLVDDALRDVDRLERTIDDLVSLARDVRSDSTPRPFATFLHEARRRWEPALAAAGRPLLLDLEPELPWVSARPEAIRQILDVLLDNALTHGDGAVVLSATRVGQGAVAAIKDHGDQVIHPEDVFRRRNHNAAGSGIGLALARRLADAEGLRLFVADAGPGVVFHLACSGKLTTSAP